MTVNPDTPVPAGGADTPRRWHSDLWVAAAIILFCAAAFAVTLTFEEIPATLAQGMQAAAFPQLVIAVLVALALVLAMTSRSRPDRARENEKIPAVFYQTCFFGLAFMGAIYAAGLLVATPLAVAGIGRLWGEKRWWLLILVGAGLAIALRLLFINGFGVQLPRGLILERYW